MAVYLMWLPLLAPGVFFGLMAALQALDALSTAKALRNGGSEANGLLRRLMKAVGVNEALFLAKVGYLAWLWFHPPTLPLEQWALLAVYVAVAVNNLRVLRGLKK